VGTGHTRTPTNLDLMDGQCRVIVTKSAFSWHGGSGEPMTMASSSMPFSSRPFTAVVINRWGHWAAQLLIGAICAAILLRVVPIAPDNLMAVGAPVALMTLVVVTWLLMRKHDRRLCEHCMTAMPLNAAESAARYRRRLATAHLGSNKLLVVAYLAVLVGSVFLPGRVGLAIWAIAQATMIYLLLSYTTHRRLQPWCRACRGRGGEDEKVDTPDPVPHGFQNA
jgi:hypothetical protein